MTLCWLTRSWLSKTVLAVYPPSSPTSDRPTVTFEVDYTFAEVVIGALIFATVL